MAQGVFGAMLQPTALALLRRNFPAEKLNSALGIWGAVIGASTAAGPIVGGLLVQHVNWEACFYINIPVGLIALLTGIAVLRELRAGEPLLPLTGMLIVASPLSGALINRLGPRIPLVGGMALAAVALFGLSRIGLSSSLNDTIGWFALLGLGLSPVMVGATDVIVGNAPVRLAGVAGGLQSTAMQVGGTIGTAVLGAIMSAQVDALLPARWAAAHLPLLTGAQLAAVKSAATVGVAPDASARVAAVVHGTFVSGMNAAFLVAAVVALAGALLALLVRRGRAVEGGAAAV